jgi:hypothetical protein
VFQNPELFPTQVSLSSEHSTLGVICFVPISRCWDGTLRDTEHVPFLWRLASPKRARNLTMSTFGRERLSWWFSISFSDVETPVSSIWVEKFSSIETVGTWMGDRLMGLCSSYLQGNNWTAVGFRCCITSWGIDPMHCTTHALWSPGWMYICCERTMSGVKPCKVLYKCSSGAGRLTRTPTKTES